MNPIVIDDPHDPRIQSFRAVRDADLRGRDGLFCVESPRVIRRFLFALVTDCEGSRMLPRPSLHSVLASEQVLDSLEPLLKEAIARENRAIPVYVAPQKALTTISGYRMHMGALALGIRPESADLDGLMGVLGPTDHLLVPTGVVHTDNIGAIFRNAGSFGGCGVLLAQGSSDPLHRKSIRIAAGRTFSVPWGISQEWPHDLSRLRDEFGFAIVAAEDAPHALTLDQLAECSRIAQARRVAIILGAEGAGLTEETMALCDAVCAVPMREPGGLVESDDRPSLNVAVASALFLHRVRGINRHARPAGL